MSRYLVVSHRGISASNTVKTDDGPRPPRPSPFRASTRYPIDKDILMIGRPDPRTMDHPDIDIPIDYSMDDGVSRLHARVIRENDAYFVEDIGSTNGTFLNGELLMLQFRVPLAPGDCIRIGETTEIIFE